MDTFRALTLNLFAHQHADGDRRQQVTRRELSRLSPDVVALQEVTRLDDFDQAADLLGDQYTVVDHPGASDDGVGACLAVRWPVVSVDVLDLTRVPGGDAVPWSATVAVEVAAPDPWGPMLLVHHKPTFELDREAVRERQSVAAARFVEELVADRTGTPVVLLGDLDASPDSAACGSGRDGSRWRAPASATRTHGRRGTATAPVTRSRRRTRSFAPGRCRRRPVGGSTT